jgi:hypothetical protein
MRIKLLVAATVAALAGLTLLSAAHAGHSLRPAGQVQLAEGAKSGDGDGTIVK